jgi:ribonuclease Z
MKLILLGTAGYHPNDRRHTLCLLLPECGIMLDAGTGVFRVARYLRTPTLDIFLTHAHLDHVIGLTYLFDILYPQSLARVTVHADPEKLAAIDQHLFSPLLFPKKPPYESRPLAKEVPLPNGGRLTHFPLGHPGGVIGYRLDWPGHSMAYITDTTAKPNAPYVASIRGVDLLVHECYFTDDQQQWAEKTGHSCTTAVAEVARAAQVGRLVLLHFNPLAAGDDPIGLDRIRAIFPCADLGVDCMEIEF